MKKFQVAWFLDAGFVQASKTTRTRKKKMKSRKFIFSHPISWSGPVLLNKVGSGHGSWWESTAFSVNIRYCFL